MLVLEYCNVLCNNINPGHVIQSGHLTRLNQIPDR